MPQQKHQCDLEGCDQPHCKKCGGHYDPACSGDRPGICDECQINAAAAEAEAVTKAFGGNSEAAAKWMGW